MQPIEHDVAAKVEEGVDGGREQRERRGGHGCVDWGDVTVSERAGVRGRIGGEGEGARTLERAEDEVAEEAGVDGDLDLRETVRHWDAGSEEGRECVRAAWWWPPLPWPLLCVPRWASAMM